MPYVITSPCQTSKDGACAAVCPVDCIHPTRDEPGYGDAAQLYIDPDECIECDACLEACPVDAIFDLPDVPEGERESIALNADYYR